MASHQNAGALEHFTTTITGLFVAAWEERDIECLRLMEEAVTQDPSSPRACYAFAILHRHCSEALQADELGLQFWCMLRRPPQASLFLRRTIAKAYERIRDSNEALAVFQHELDQGVRTPPTRSTYYEYIQ